MSSERSYFASSTFSKTVTFEVDQSFRAVQKVGFLVNPVAVVCEVGGFTAIVLTLCWLLVHPFDT